MRGIVKTVLLVACALLVTSASAITILKQPTATTVNAGSTATFTVITTNGTVTAYQWFLGTKPLQDGITNGAIISGSQTASLTIENVGTNLNAGLFKVAISNSAAPVFSVAARLTVLRGTLIKFDTALGTMVLELFDHDKPLAVQSFLHYTTLGLYKNSFFSRLEPGFVLQGGGYAASDTGNTPFAFVTNIQLNAFYCIGGFPGAIANEAGRSPRVRNTFGTIGLAQLDGYPDSGDNQFYFNLADNSDNSAHNLDASPGYTVFGRVVSGTDVLDGFNSIPAANIVSNGVQQVYCGGPFALSIPSLPVKTTDANNIHNSDLYFTGISLMPSQLPYIDLVRPSCKVIYPAAGARVHFGPLRITGSATDNLGVARIECIMFRYGTIGDNTGGTIVNQEFSVPVSGTNSPIRATTNWVVTLDPAVGFGNPPLYYTPGPWTINLIVHDAHGNRTDIVQPFVATTPVSMNVNGRGTIVPNLNGQYLEVGKIYRASASPGPGQLFGYWTGLRVSVHDTNGVAHWVPTVSYNPALVFTNMTNLTITANFVSNYFPVVQGTYYGLIAPTDHNSINVTNAGLCKIVSSSLGTYSGTMSIQGKVWPFIGRWDYTGNSTVSIPRTGMSSLLAHLTLDLSNNLGMVTGTVSSVNWTSDITTYRSVTKLTTNSTPVPRNYVMKIPTRDQNSDLGDSFATLTVSSAGLLTFAGTMADNTPWTESVGIGRDGNFPIFASLYTGRGLLIGLQQFATPTNSMGATRWIRPAISNAYYTNGFSTPAFFGYIDAFVRPPINSAYNLRLGGNTLPEVPFGLQTAATGQFLVTSGPTNRPRLTLTLTTGALVGTWTDSNKGVWTLRGIFQSPTAGGTGFILGPHGQTGYLHIDPL